jgi:hypothetical protein
VAARIARIGTDSRLESASPIRATQRGGTPVDRSTAPGPVGDAGRLRRPGAAWLVAAGLVSAGVIAYANREPLFWDQGLSVNDVWSRGDRLAPLMLFVLPILGAVLSLALATPGRTAAAAALAILGLAGFANYLGSFGSVLEVDAGAAGRGLELGLLGSILMIAAGLAAGFGAASGPPSSVRTGVTWVVAAVGTLALLGPTAYLIGEYRFWYFFPLLVLLPAAVALARALRRLTPLAGGAALTMLGLSILVTYADLLGDLLGTDLGDLVTASVDALALAAGVFTVLGLALLATDTRVPPATDEPAADERGADARSEATRHLCVALHLDRDLARRAMREVVDGEARAVAPSLGIDLGVVVRHCLVARHRQLVRDAVLGCVAGLLVLELFALVVHRDAAVLRHVLLTLLLGWLAVAVERFVARHLVVGRRLSREAFARQRTPLLDAAEESRVRALERLERGNVTPYGGFFPFVGSGREVGGWSFALSVLRGSQGIGGEPLEPAAFELADLYETVRRDIDRLGIEGLAVEDRLYVDGEELAADRRFLDAGPPPRLRTEVTPEQLGELVRTPERVNRVYRCIRVHGWSGEYVLSVYLNFTLAGPGLFAEARYFLLLPPKPEYVALGQGIVPPSAGALFGTAGAALRATPRALVTAVRGVSGDVRDLSRPPVVVGADTRAGVVNHGATTSLRELAQGTAHRRYFQRLDLEMTTKIVERQLLESIARFLREHRVDTSELEERQTAILNYGLIVSGGSVTAESVAVGQGAQSLVSRIGAAIRQPAEERVRK